MKTTDYKGAAGDPPIEKDKPSAKENAEVQEARKHHSNKDREKPPPVIYQRHLL